MIYLEFLLELQDPILIHQMYQDKIYLTSVFLKVFHHLVILILYKYGKNFISILLLF
jgi:hypothetical protein